MAVRMTWKGQLNLGLVSVPVGLATAVREKDVRFSQFTEDLHPVGRQAYDKETGEILAAADVKKGYKVGDKVVLVTDEELDALAPASTKALDVVCTVNHIDPMLYASHQWIVPQEGAEAAYGLLVESLAESNMVAIAKTVRRSKAHIVAIRSNGEALIASFLHYADEVVDNPVGQVSGAQSQHKSLMVKLLSDMLKPTDALTDFHDEQREKVLGFLEAKAQGVEAPIIEQPKADAAMDLLAALEASVKQAGA